MLSWDSLVRRIVVQRPPKTLSLSIKAPIGEFPKIKGTLFGVLIIRILLFRVLYEGPLFLELAAEDDSQMAGKTMSSSANIAFWRAPPFQDSKPTVWGLGA